MEFLRLNPSADLSEAALTEAHHQAGSPKEFMLICTKTDFTTARIIKHEILSIDPESPIRKMEIVIHPKWPADSWAILGPDKIVFSEV